MKKLKIVKPKRGRPPSGGRDPFVGVRLSSELLQLIDIWSLTAEASSRSEAIRRLVELGLTVRSKTKSPASSQRDRARELAGKAIDKMADADASSDDHGGRKRRLIKGPEESRVTGVDRAKAKKL